MKEPFRTLSRWCAGLIEFLGNPDCPTPISQDDEVCEHGNTRDEDCWECPGTFIPAGRRTTKS